MIRKTAVAGQFYPSNPEELRETIESPEIKKTPKIRATGIILPHAGYIYSGGVAIATVSRVLPKKKVIILGPNHTGRGEPFSIFARGKWEIPGNGIEIDRDLAERILAQGDCIEEDPMAHEDEHSIEVQLPILAHFFGNFSLVPIVCSMANINIYRKIAEQIYKAVADIKDDILLVASSDMSHYEKDETARRKDRIATESILSMDEEELIKRVEEEKISMCGVAPVAIVLSCCKLLKAKKAQVTLYQTSGDASGDYSSVVGYLGIIIN